MTKTQFYLSFVFAALAIFAIALFLFTGSQNVKAAAGQLPGTVATSSRATVNTTAAVGFATSTNCAAREIGTASSSVMLTFTDKDTPSNSVGFFQAASSTVAYDASVYGCGQVKIYSFNAQQVTLQEVQ